MAVLEIPVFAKLIIFTVLKHLIESLYRVPGLPDDFHPWHYHNFKLHYLGTTEIWQKVKLHYFRHYNRKFCRKCLILKILWQFFHMQHNWAFFALVHYLMSKAQQILGGRKAGIWAQKWEIGSASRKVSSATEL